MNLIYRLAVVSMLFCSILSGVSAQDVTDRPTDPELIATAQAEGALTVYGTSSVAALQSDADKFREAYGIEVSFVQLTSGPITARINQEIKAGGINADIVMSGDRPTMVRWSTDGALAKLPEFEFPDRDDYLANIQVSFHGLAYNTDAAAQLGVIPANWGDALNPAYDGKIVLGSPRISPAYSQLYYALLKNPKYGEAFFKSLAALHPRIIDTPALLTQMVASGEASIGFPVSRYYTAQLKEQNAGAPIEQIYLDIATMAPTYLGLSATAQHPNAAKLFALWMMSREGQTSHNGSGRASSVLQGLPGTIEGPTQEQLDRSATVEAVTTEYDELIAMFDRLYQ